jgi:hypothetical protein
MKIEDAVELVTGVAEALLRDPKAVARLLA